MKQHFLFDLDGTLIDSAPSILGSFRQAFKQAGIEPQRPLTPEMIGPPLMQTLAKLAGVADFNVLNDLATKFKAYYDSEGYKQANPFSGTASLLEKLHAGGNHLYIATNKRYYPTMQIMRHLQWEKFFTGIYALDYCEPALTNKARLVEHILQKHAIAKENAIYIGDRYEDGVAADDNKIAYAMVNWGYIDTSVAELQPHWQQCTNLKELENILLLNQ